MSQHQNLAKRYAKALLDLSEKAGESQQVADELQRFQALLVASSDLEAIYNNPVFAHEKRIAIVQQIGEKEGFCSMTQKFLRFLIDKKRTQIFAEIAKTFRQLLDHKQRKLSVRIVSAKVLPESLIDELRQHLKASTQQNEVHFDTEIDPSLIGGVAVWIGDKVYDGTIKGRLSRMKEHLLEQI